MTGRPAPSGVRNQAIRNRVGPVPPTPKNEPRKRASRRHRRSTPDAVPAAIAAASRPEAELEPESSLPATHGSENHEPQVGLELLDLAEARQRIAELLQRNQPLPDDLHDASLRLELAAAPFDISLTSARIALLDRLGRPPMPELSQDEIDSASAIEKLLEQAAEHAKSGDIYGDYACLWQIVVRYPESARGWAEYARRFAQRRDWANCRLALSKALAWSQRPDAATALAMLAALRALAISQQLDGVEWREWVQRLPDGLQTHPLVAELILWTGNLNRATALLLSLVRDEQPDFERCIAAANIVYEQENWAEAYRYWREAFEIDLPRTLRSAIVDHSARLNHILNETEQSDDLADWLTAQSKDHEGVNLIPPLWSPESEHAARERRERALARGLPSVLLVPHAKAASASVGNLFSSGFDLAPAIYSLIARRVVAPWLADYLRGGACYVTHLAPSERNIALLAADGAPTVIVQVRDPRQIVVSVAGHIRKYPAEIPPSLRSAGELRDIVGTIIEQQCAQAIEWMDGWVKARSTLNIAFTTFEEFVRDRDAFVDRILSLYGGDRRYFHKELALQEHAGLDYHRRSGRTDEWREILTPEQVEQINRQIPDPFWQLFGWVP